MPALILTVSLVAYAIMFSLVAKSLPSQNEIKQVVKEFSK